MIIEIRHTKLTVKQPKSAILYISTDTKINVAIPMAIKYPPNTARFSVTPCKSGLANTVLLGASISNTI
ncbi:MAG: hypothetical protein C4545_05820 [Anaerolineaceae bacterium]|nr:MAG: hypothetical protein C4545_05820 [Anaerolineaceae bacterium]